MANARASGLLRYKKKSVLFAEDILIPCVDMSKPIARNEGLRFDSIKVFCPPNESLKADPAALQQVVYNLLANAIKYRRRGDPRSFRIELYGGFVSGTSRAFVECWDWGVGVEPNEAKRIYDYGYRGAGVHKFDVKGIGLGLYIARQIAEDLKGTLEVVEHGEPTKFRFEFAVG